MARRDSPLVHHPNVRLMSRPRWHTRPGFDANPAPPGLEHKSYEDSLEGFAEWMADWQEFTGATLGRGSMGRANNYENAAFIGHGVGFHEKPYKKMSDQPPIATYMLDEVCLHPDDALPTLDQLDGSTWTKHPWYELTLIPPERRTRTQQDRIDQWNNDLRFRVWYNQNGITAAKDFMYAFVPILKRELDSRHLCYFGVLTHDLERHNNNALIHTASSDWPQGFSWWSWAMEDPRFSTAVILKFNGVSYTFEDLWNEAQANGVPAPDLTKSRWHEDNRQWDIWYTGVSQAILNYVIEESISKPWKRGFPESRVGNFRNALVDNHNYPLINLHNTNLRWGWNERHSLDYSSRSLYFPGSAHPEILCDEQYLGGFFPCSMSAFDMWREYNLLRFDAMANSSKRFDILPWIAMPHFRKEAGVFRAIDDPIAGSTPDHCMDAEGWCFYSQAPGGNPWIGMANTYWLLTELVNRRVKEFAIWGPDFSTLDEGHYAPQWRDADEFLQEYEALILSIVDHADNQRCLETHHDPVVEAMNELQDGKISVEEFLNQITDQ